MTVNSTPKPPHHAHSRARLLPAALIAGGLLLSSALATAATPAIRGTHPVQNGELVGNTVMFVGYDLADGGTTPKVEVANDTDNSIVPVRVTSRCKRGSTKAAPQRCNVLVRLLKWTVGHRYRAVLHGFTLNFTIVKGDPGKRRRKPSAGKRPAKKRPATKRPATK